MQVFVINILIGNGIFNDNKIVKKKIINIDYISSIVNNLLKIKNLKKLFKLKKSYFAKINANKVFKRNFLIFKARIVFIKLIKIFIKVSIIY